MNETSSSLAAAAVISYVIAFMKNSDLPVFGWISKETPKLNRFVAFVLSGFAALGIHVHLTGSFSAGWTGGFVVPSGPVLGYALWHWLVQFCYTHGWFKATSQNEELLAMVRKLALQALTPSQGGSPNMKQVGNALTILLLAVALVFACGHVAQAQTTAPSAFPSTSVNFNLTPITLPGAKTAVAGAETDVKLKITNNMQIGETTLVSGDYSFVGGRGDYVIAPFSKWLNNISPMLNGYQFQLYVTGSAGAVRTPLARGVNQSHWGERAGFGLNYAVSGNLGLGFEGQWCNFPGYQHTTYSIAFGPNFHF